MDISSRRPYVRLNTPRKEGGLGGAVKYPLLADHNASISKRYGCYCFAEGNAYRALYILDREGILRHVSINDMAVGRNVDETIRLVQAFQYTDEHGMVCPAGWKPGDDAMTADPEKSKEYFSRHWNFVMYQTDSLKPCGRSRGFTLIILLVPEQIWVPPIQKHPSQTPCFQNRGYRIQKLLWWAPQSCRRPTTSMWPNQSYPNRTIR